MNIIKFAISILLLIPYTSYAYEATCYSQYGEHYSNKIWNISVKDKKVYLSSGNIKDTLFYTPKGDDVFCYYNYPTGSEFEQMITEANLCLGKFQDGIFPYEFYYSEHVEYGICIKDDEKINSIPDNKDSLPLSDKAKNNGFIALSFGPMKWDEAVQWCKNKGGRLPEIDNKDKIYYSFPKNTYYIITNGKIDTNYDMKRSTITGFKGGGINWNEIGLPNPATYWTATSIYHEGTNGTSLSGIYTIGGIGKTSIYSQSNNELSRAACINSN